MTDVLARLLAVNVVHEVIRGPTRWTAIDKRPVRGPVDVGELGLVGDRQCDTRYHGGPDKALGAYLKVLETGSVRAGNRILVVHRPDDGPTIGEASRRA
ncbi:hypothetical protein [Kribbella kalugense]|uniref:MOSC domain-containing protein n=1 Tax=Kribbella kalugense TaxID=2512221 RepID=A0A4R7ZCC3_9ACTN|nr:hypothetical protein [Kribbella kalugense]TDW15207.1 hypothetical protein EV650_6689 [Kribbella kalugense]